MRRRIHAGLPPLRPPSRLQGLILLAALLPLAACDDEAIPRPLPDMVEVAVGDAHSCALAAAGEVFCWGDGSAGQLGTGGTASHELGVPVETAEGFSTIAAGGRHTCALTAAGEAFCWGANEWGQAGVPAFAPVLEPRPVETDLRFNALSAGWRHTCGIATDGLGYCWGAGNDGALGGGQLLSRSAAPVPVDTALRFSEISAGGRHTCGIAESGRAYCWGANDLGQLGNGTDGEPLATPAPVDAAAIFTDIAAGYGHTCGIRTGGDAYCWGENGYGELGLQRSWYPGEPAERSPVAVRSFGEVYVEISAGRHYTCALRNQGELMCWGSGRYGQLGTGDMDDYSLRQLVLRPPGGPAAPGRGVFAGVDAGGTTHTCGVTTGGGVLCWGQGEHGQLGTGHWFTMLPHPVVLAPEP